MAEKTRFRMVCARWDSATGHGVKLQPLTLAFFSTEAAHRARGMGGHLHLGFEIVPVDIVITEADI